MQNDSQTWTEDNSADYARWEDALVPRRAEQFAAITHLAGGPGRILELCCGTGRLAERLLESHPAAEVLGLDGSERMLAAAGERLRRFGPRAVLQQFSLASSDWRQGGPFQSVVSSLAIHHLDGPGKAQLYADLFGLLAPGGRLVIADLIEPQDPAGNDLAAAVYDDLVRRQSLEQYGDGRAFEFFEREGWNLFRHPDPGFDMPSGLFDQLNWLAQAGFRAVDVYWMAAGHAVYGGLRCD